MSIQADPAHLTPESAVYGIPTLSGAAISPDGARVVFARTDVSQETGKPETQLWIVDAAGADAVPRQLTRTGTANTAPAWSPDGTTLAFVTRRDGDKSFAIALLTVEGGEPRVLVRHATAPASLAFSPDGATLAYVKPVDPDNPDETPRDPKAPAPVRVVRRIDYKQDGIGFVNDVRNQVFLLDLATGTTRQLTHGPSDHVKPDWSPDGSRLAVIVPHRNGQRSRIGIVDATTGETRVVGVEEGEVGLPSWSPDGTRIALSFNPTGGHHHGFFLLDPEAGEFTPVVDDPAFLIDASWLSTAKPAWLDGTVLLLAGHARGASGLWRVDTATGEASEAGAWRAIQSGLSLPADASVAVQTSTSIDGEIAVVATTLDGTTTRTILYDAGKDAFAGIDLAGWERIEAPSDGFSIEAWVIRPPRFDPGTAYPVILDIHGGPHGAYGYGFNLSANLLAAAGYVVILANPRGSTSYGRAFTDAVLGDWGDGPWRDLQAVLNAVLAEPWADATRTGVFGYSYGGYMASWIVGHTDRFRAAVIGAPVFDLESMFGTGDIGHSFVPEQNRATPWQDRDRLMAQSPSTFIQHATTPTLVIHGEADERCPIGQGEQLFTSLMKLGVETEFARYPGGFHGFISTGEPAHRIDAHTRIRAWFDRFLMRGERREE